MPDAPRRVLLVEDDVMICEIIEYNLKKEGYETVTAYDGLIGLRQALDAKPDIIILDVMLPGMDGFEICRRVREKSPVPIIMLTAREEEGDKVMGLDLGADDYITKPYSMRELISRVNAHIRRSQMQNAGAEKSSNIIEAGGLRINADLFSVTKDGREIELSSREFELLKLLASNPEKVFTREELMESVWGYNFYGDLRAVNVAMSRLREKLEDDPATPRYILTKRNVGYYFAKQGEITAV